jgi:hypothetical protein
MFIGILIFLSGLFVSGVAAYYSIMGLIAIFASAQFAIAIMGVSLEVAKLVTAAWLHYNWTKVNVLMKAYLSSAVVLLIFITSMGIFGFLSKAHIDQTLSVGDNSVVITRLEQQITRELTIISDDDIKDFTDFTSVQVHEPLEEATSVNPETGEEVKLRPTDFGSEGVVFVPDIDMTEEQVAEAKEIFRQKAEPSTLWDKFWKHKQESERGNN